MGTWKLEVLRMAIYMAFPVGLFHYFNQPENFEEWVTKVKRETYPPENKENTLLLRKTIEEHQAAYQKKVLEALEASQAQIDKDKLKN
ncbi:protein PET100 homolog, mitochondrial [Cephus cinctus]|uniref:Protein PET100 homolog, mitochondrial n=1 Tax=Cephus cinctus TaxID=211228 RepID=A0AAJ7FG76_CEPCN|nr:protein PET100 homolog, mitochondrial [Cephus cinctus]